MVSADLLAQFFVNGIVLGSVLALSAIGLTLVYGILNLTNFAHGDYMTLGAYVALFFNLMIVAQGEIAQAVTFALVLAAAIALVPALEAALRHGVGPERSRRGLGVAGKAFALGGVVLVATRASDLLARVTAANLVETLVGTLLVAAACAWGVWLLRGHGLPGARNAPAATVPAVYMGALVVLGALVPLVLSGSLGTLARIFLWIPGLLVGGAWLLGLRGKIGWDQDARERSARRLRGAGVVAAFLAAGAVLALVVVAVTGSLPRGLIWNGALALFALAAIAGTASAGTGRIERMEAYVMYGAAVAIAVIALARWLGPDAGLPRALTSPILLPAVLSIAVVPLFSVAMDVIIWKPLRRQGATVLTLIIVSIGLALALRHILVVRFGGGLRRYEGTTGGLLEIGEFILGTRTQLIIVVTALALILLVHVILKYTRVGKGLRALSDNMELARVTGIDVDRMILYVWVIGGALTGVAGVLLAWNVNVNPNLGFQFLLPIFAAVILGGIGSPYGAMAGGLVIGIAMEVSVAWVPEYRTAVAFVVLILVLLVRPQGILGGKA